MPRARSGTRSSMTANDRLIRLERAVSELIEQVGRYQPVPLSRTPALREIASAVAGSGVETRPAPGAPEIRKQVGV